MSSALVEPFHISAKVPKFLQAKLRMEYENDIDSDPAPGGAAALAEPYDHMLIANGNTAYSLGHPSLQLNNLDENFEMTFMPTGRTIDDEYQPTQGIFFPQDFSAFRESCQYPDAMTVEPGFLDAQSIPMPAFNEYSWPEYDDLDEIGRDPYLGASSLGLNRLNAQQENSEHCENNLNMIMHCAQFDFEAPYNEAHVSADDSGIFSGALNPSNAECMSGKRKKAILSTSSSASETTKSMSRSRPRKIRQIKFSEDQIRPLYTWLEKHLSDPFPEAEDKIKLSSASGLSISQVESWFARTRRRKLFPLKLLSNTPQISPVDGNHEVQPHSPRFDLNLAQLRHNREARRELTAIPRSTKLFLHPDLCMASSVFPNQSPIIPLYLDVTTDRGQSIRSLLNRRSRSCPAAFRSQSYTDTSTRALRAPFRDGVASPEVVLSSLEAVPSTRQGTPFAEGSLPFELDPSDHLMVIGGAESRFNKGIPSSPRDWSIEGFLNSLPDDGDYLNWEDPNSLVPVSGNLQVDLGPPPNSPFGRVVQDHDDIISLKDGEISAHHAFATDTSRRYGCYCTKTFPSHESLVVHLSTHVEFDPQPSRCWRCSCTFRNEAELNTHIQIQHPDQRLVCENCGTCYSSLGLSPKNDSLCPTCRVSRNFSLETMNPPESVHDKASMKGYRLPTSRPSSCGSAGSVASGGSYGTFGPRKGRRLAYGTPPLESRRASVQLADTTEPGSFFVGIARTESNVTRACFYAGCDHAVPSCGFTDSLSFFDHMKKVHAWGPPKSDDDSESDREREGSTQLPENLGEKSSSSIVPLIPSQKKASYQCTFCHKPFSGKFEWRRHEESVHVPQKEWVCALYNFVKHIMSRDSMCILCGLDFPRNERLKHANDDHSALSCWQKPEKDRTFYRKDHLVQHTRQVHCQKAGRDLNIDLINAGCRRTEQAKSKSSLHCGFCGLQNETWDARAKHIPTHFDEGLDMSSWRPLEAWT